MVHTDVIRAPRRFCLVISTVLLPWYAVAHNTVPQWATAYSTVYSANERMRNKQKSELIFKKSHVMPFSQLIFSWNAAHPVVGHFSFAVQVRNAATKIWGAWHPMATWGAYKQRTHATKSDGHAKYLYVRLETEKDAYADAFQVKAVPHGGASLSQVHGLAVGLADFTRFCPEPVTTLSGLSSVHIPAVPMLSQHQLPHRYRAEMCCPTSCSMVAAYLTQQKINTVHFAEYSFDYGLRMYGSWQFTVARLFHAMDARMRVFTRRLNSFAELHGQLERGIPAIVSVRGWWPGAAKAHDDGHFFVVVGFDAATQQVVCHDPAHPTNQQTIKRYALHDFVRAWERSRRLVYWIEPITTYKGEV